MNCTLYHLLFIYYYCFQLTFFFYFSINPLFDYYIITYLGNFIGSSNFYTVRLIISVKSEPLFIEPLVLEHKMTSIVNIDY